MMPLTVRPAIDPIRKATWLIPRERPSSSAGVASTIIAALFVKRIAEPSPAIRTPTVVTVRTVHLYLIRTPPADRPHSLTGVRWLDGGARRSGTATSSLRIGAGNGPGRHATLTLWIGWCRAMRSRETR